MNLRSFALLTLLSPIVLPYAASQITVRTLAASAPAPVPPLVPYSGQVAGRTGQASATFLIFKDQTGGEPLFTESQTVALDDAGRYRVELGAASPSGLPSDLFATGEARWLEVQMAGQPAEPRVLLASVPYALKAADSATLGGLPASAFVLAGSNVAVANAASAAITPEAATTVTTTGGTANQIAKFSGSNTIVNSLIYDNGTAVGIGTTTPSSTLTVNGTTTLDGTTYFNGQVFFNQTGTATAATGYPSQAFKFQGSAYDSSTKSVVYPRFGWQTEPTGNNTASPGGTLNLVATPGTPPLAETGFYINTDGTIHFAPGQTFPGTGNGTITGVTAGTGLTGGGTSGNVTLELDTTKVPLLAANNAFTGNQTITGNLSVSGTATAGVVNAANGFDLGGSRFAFGSPVNGSVFLGFAGSTSSTGISNTASGFQALNANSTGSYNTANGHAALYSNTTGENNTASGLEALYSNTTGYNNTASGVLALYYNTTGYDNAASGLEALYSNTTGYNNTANGLQALSLNTTGSSNTANGYQALLSNTTGSNNTASGVEALYSNNTGYDNTAYGVEALRSNTTGIRNVASGGSALYENTVGSYNTASGYDALSNNATGYNNTASGYFALGTNDTGSNNVAVGAYALSSGLSGGDNVAVGNSALSLSISGDYNVAVGSYALDPADKSGATGSANTAIGYSAVLSTGSISNATAIGAYAEVDQSNSMVLGCVPGTVLFEVSVCPVGISVGIGTTAPDNLLTVNGSADKPGGGSWGTYSDGRLKTVSGRFSSGLDQVMQLRPIRYHYKPGNGMGIRDMDEHIGVVAQEVQRIIPEAVTENGKGYLLVNNDPIIWSMVNAIKEQQREIEQQQELLRAQNAVNEKQAKRLRAQGAAMQSLAAEVRETHMTLRQVKALSAAGQLTMVAAK